MHGWVCTIIKGSYLLIDAIKRSLPLVEPAIAGRDHAGFFVEALRDLFLEILEVLAEVIYAMA